VLRKDIMRTAALETPEDRLIAEFEILCTFGVVKLAKKID
jgi:hypothetical protein